MESLLFQSVPIPLQVLKFGIYIQGQSHYHCHYHYYGDDADDNEDDDDNEEYTHLLSDACMTHIDCVYSSISLTSTYLRQM